jgi:hypothetical protein
MSKERELLKRFMTKLTTEEDVVSLFNDIKECLAEPELLEEVHQEHNKPRCCICKTTENVKYVGGYQAYRCPSPDCVPF